MATIIGTNSNNTLNGTTSADMIIGRAGTDQLFGNGGNDLLNGGTQNDLLNGGLGIDTADYSNLLISGTTYLGATAGVTVNLSLAGAQNTGGAGSDTLVSIENLVGTNFNDALTGNSGTNLLLSLGGNDTLNGGSGNDMLAGGLGNDTLNGGTGIDTADYGNIRFDGSSTTYIGASSGVTVNLSLTGAQNTGGAGSDTLVSMENLTGTNFSGDFLTGNGGGNVLAGLAGNDTLNGGAGNDTLSGGAGNDWLDGGDGIDTASYLTATAGVTVDLYRFGGQAQNTGGAGIDTLLNVENLTGSNFNDSLTGYGFLKGAAGNDELIADHVGDSTLNGDAGNDSLWAVESVNVTLNGGTGNDRLVAVEGFGSTLNGGDGNDELVYEEYTLGTLNGGAGADTLYCGGFASTISDYNSVSDSPAGTGRDVIHEFSSGESDTPTDQIDLTTIDANVLMSGNQAFSWIGGAAFTAAGQLRYNTTTGILQGSTDGDTAAEFEIQLVGAPALSVGGAGSDILL
jgi:Ca2+-binding RTX toxin-like protein